MHPTFLLLFVWLRCVTFALAGDAPDATKPADIENMKKIGEALNAYKKAKGEYPAHLSDLVPDFLADPKTLVSPLGVEADPRAAKGGYDPKLPCSYFYGEGGDRKGPNLWLQEYGLAFPILSCYLYEKHLSISYGGDFYEYSGRWDSDPETLRLMKKYGPGPGVDGKKLTLTLVDPSGHPVPGVVILANERFCASVRLPLWERTSDEHGRVVIPLGSDAKPDVIYFSKSTDWYILTRKWRFGDEGTAPDGESASLTVATYPAATVGGIVRDHSGAPLADAAVIVYAVQNQPSQPLTNAKTDASGKWSANSIPKQGVLLELTVAHPGNRTLHLRPTAQTHPAADELFGHTADIQLAPPVAVKGTVRFHQQPLPKTKVYLYPFSGRQANVTTTDESGQFELAVEDQGVTSLLTFAPNLAPSEQRIRPGLDPKPITVEMEAGRPLKGRILRGPRTGVPNAPILFQGFRTMLGYRLPERPVIATTDADGSFTWEHAPRAKVLCTVLLPDGTESLFEWDATKNDDHLVHLEP